MEDKSQLIMNKTHPGYAFFYSSISDYLSPADLSNACLVSKNWQKTFSDRNIWLNKLQVITKYSCQKEPAKLTYMKVISGIKADEETRVQKIKDFEYASMFLLTPAINENISHYEIIAIMSLHPQILPVFQENKSLLTKLEFAVWILFDISPDKLQSFFGKFMELVKTNDTLKSLLQKNETISQKILKTLPNLEYNLSQTFDIQSAKEAYYSVIQSGEIDFKILNLTERRENFLRRPAKCSIS